MNARVSVLLNDKIHRMTHALFADNFSHVVDAILWGKWSSVHSLSFLRISYRDTYRCLATEICQYIAVDQLAIVDMRVRILFGSYSLTVRFGSDLVRQTIWIRELCSVRLDPKIGFVFGLIGVSVPLLRSARITRAGWPHWTERLYTVQSFFRWSYSVHMYKVCSCTRNRLL